MIHRSPHINIQLDVCVVHVMQSVGDALRVLLEHVGVRRPALACGPRLRVQVVRLIGDLVKERDFDVLGVP